MRRLAFDCSGDLRSVAVSTGDRVLAEQDEHGPREHAERLVPMLGEVLNVAAWSWADVDEIVVANGPGSFTGIRIAVATARALALALDRPVRPISTLRALLITGGPDCSLAAIDARRGGVYYALRDGSLGGLGSSARVASPAGAAAAAARPLKAIGSGAHLVCGAAGEGLAIELPLHARALVACAIADARSGDKAVAGRAVRPIYLRAADAVPQAA